MVFYCKSLFAAALPLFPNPYSSLGLRIMGGITELLFYEKRESFSSWIEAKFAFFLKFGTASL